MFAVLPENWEAVTVFLDCDTQWRTGGMSGVVTGLDYSAVRAVCGARRVRFGAIFDKLKTIEVAALSAMAERRDG